MTLTLLLWLLTFLVLGAASLRRPAWAVALYMLTFFLSPPFWWWGRPVADYRWNLYSGLILVASVVINGAYRETNPLVKTISKRYLLIAAAMVVNATAVHFMLAPNLAISSDSYVLLVKMMLLFAMMVFAIRSEQDLKIVITAIALGAAYIGYEVTINDRGKIIRGRLEGVGVPGASTANDLACLMVASIAFVPPLFLFGGLKEKLIAVVAGPFALNVLLLCNSRGAFLALIALVITYIVAAPKSIRRQVYKITVLGLIALWFLLGDPRIVERFMTTFTDTEELDHSASSRLDFWKAGLMMIADHPLGAGGHGFKDVYGVRYIARVTGDATARSVHQGYINEACEWGLQGLALRILLLGGGLLLAWKTSKLAIATGQWMVAGVALSMLAGIAGLFVQSLFGTFLDSEWGLWMVAIAIGCRRLCEQEEGQVSAEFENHGHIDEPPPRSAAMPVF